MTRRFGPENVELLVNGGRVNFHVGVKELVPLEAARHAILPQSK